MADGGGGWQLIGTPLQRDETDSGGVPSLDKERC